jgi:Ran GTPase-activating protein (RanGAP) involved in mRNA processing and transport
VDLEQNSIGDKGIDAVCKSIKNNIKGDFSILNLSSNNLGVQACIRLSHLLRKRPENYQPLNIKLLNLSKNQISNVGTETLASFMKKNKSLIYLDISFNNISDRGTMALADMLLYNQTLQVLNLLGNKIENQGVF